MLDLARPIYQKTAAYGHFGRKEPEFTWERTDKAAEHALPESPGFFLTSPPNTRSKERAPLEAGLRTGNLKTCQAQAFAMKRQQSKRIELP
jgi:hypothetical protein